MIRRRDLLAGASAAIAFGALAGCATAPNSDNDANLAALLERHAEALSARSGGGQIPDYSLAARAAARRENAVRLAELNTVTRAALSPDAALDYDVARFVYEAMDDQYGRYGFSDINLRPSPYVVSQMNGAYYWLPDGIAARAPMATAADAETYFDKLAQLARALDQETEQIAHDAALGVIPPDFILTKTIAQITALRDAASDANPLLNPAIGRARAAGIDLESRALEAFSTHVAPALTRQIVALQALAPRANSDAGVWAKPDGAAYYTSALHSNTTARHAPGDLHELGMLWVRDLAAEIDDLLRAQGLTQGDVGARMRALDRDPRFLKPDTDAGRQEIIAAANARLDRVRALLPRGFTHIPTDPVEVRRVSPAIEAGAPGGSYSGSEDPDRPSVISINLRSVEENALWRLPTLLHHEGLPGHHLQSSVLRTAPLSRFRRTVRFSAWTEGWALYAEQLADELGAYEDDPFGRIGYLQGQLFRACRVVVDTGLHHARWSRDRAIAWMVTHAGETRGGAEREIDRYCVYPGQACSFMVGKQQIVAAREAARARLGDAFNARAFNDLILASGPLPMNVLAALVARWRPGVSPRL